MSAYIGFEKRISMIYNSAIFFALYSLGLNFKPVSDLSKFFLSILFISEDILDTLLFPIASMDDANSDIANCFFSSSSIA